MMENCKAIPGEVRKSRQVESALYEQLQVIGIFQDRIVELMERLACVLRDCPCGTTGKGCERTQMVPIAEAVHGNTDKIAICTGMILDILERLEIG